MSFCFEEEGAGEVFHIKASACDGACAGGKAVVDQVRPMAKDGILLPPLVGQATVEGAFLIPVILLMLMLLIQPGVLLYDRMVMQGAAQEGCRLIATRPSGESIDAYQEFVMRRLGSIPQQSNFHVHETGCTWLVSFEGDETSSAVEVKIENQVKPLPFFDFGARALGMVNGEGNFVQRVTASASTKSLWVSSGDQGLDPSQWVGLNGSTAGGVEK